MPSHQIISQTSKEAVLNVIYNDFREELSLGRPLSFPLAVTGTEVRVGRGLGSAQHYHQCLAQSRRAVNTSNWCMNK